MTTRLPKRFRAIVARSGSKTNVVIPFDPNEIWGAKEQHYVEGSVDGHRIRGILVSDGSAFYLPLGPAWLRDHVMSSDTRVEVVLSPDGPRTDTIAADIAAALDAAPDARRFFESIAPFHRKNSIRWIESAKRPETRAARIRETVTALERGEKRQ